MSNDSIQEVDDDKVDISMLHNAGRSHLKQSWQAKAFQRINIPNINISDCDSDS